MKGPEIEIHYVALVGETVYEDKTVIESFVIDDGLAGVEEGTYVHGKAYDGLLYEIAKQDAEMSTGIVPRAIGIRWTSMR